MKMYRSPIMMIWNNRSVYKTVFKNIYLVIEKPMVQCIALCKKGKRNLFFLLKKKLYRSIIAKDLIQLSAVNMSLERSIYINWKRLCKVETIVFDGNFNCRL